MLGNKSSKYIEFDLEKNRENYLCRGIMCGEERDKLKTLKTRV